MSNPAWKKEERKIARALGGERTPLSGSNSRHTGGDVIETEYYVDAKLSGYTNGSGERYYTLQRESLLEVNQGTAEEEKRAGFLCVRFKHCSDRYVIIPSRSWEGLVPGESIDGIEPEESLHLKAQGTVSHRIYRKTLQKLDHLYSQEAGAPLMWHQWADNDIPEAAIITWESLLWLLDILECCPEGCGWQVCNSVTDETECPDCGSLMEGGA